MSWVKTGWLNAAVLLVAAGPVTADPLTSTDELAKELNNETGIVLLDAEDVDLFERAHIPGAVNLHYLDFEDAEENEESGRPIFPQLAANLLGEAGVEADSEVVIYDRGDGRAASALWYILEYLGHEKVRVLDGGFARWIAEGRQVTQDTPAPDETDYELSGEEKTAWHLKTEELQGLVDESEVTVVDARSVLEYTGQERGGAPRAGHIPGAVHLPWDRLAGKNTVFRPEEELREILDEIGLEPDDRIVTYCNPGLGRSTYLLLALHRLGYESVQVYPGSWHEWGGNPNLPIER